MSRAPARSGTKDLWQVAVVGGGIAGAVAAYHSARAGLSTVLFEKDKGPHHKVCGEFLSGEGVAYLSEMGVNFKALGAQRIRAFRLHGPTRSCEATLPMEAYGISRYLLDEELLRLSAEAGVDVRTGVIVREMSDCLESPGGAVVLETSAGEVRAKRLVVAAGKSEFRSVQSREGRDSGMVGFKMHLKLKPSVHRKIREHVDLFVFKNGYGGLSLIENGLANFCFLIERKVIKEIGTSWDALAHYIAKQNLAASNYLDGAEPQFKHFVTVSSVPYGFVRKERAQPGIFCVGDQMAVIPSLTGDGMSIAAMTGKAAARAMIDPNAHGHLLAPEFSAAYQRQMRARLKPQVDSGYALHLLFKNPQVCDFATYVVNSFPRLTDMLFTKTRCNDESLRLRPSDVKRLQV